MKRFRFVSVECMHTCVEALLPRLSPKVRAYRQTMGEELYAMNARAITALTGSHRPMPLYRYVPQLAVSKVQQVKELRQLLVYCAEGRVPREPLFRLVRARIAELEEEIAHSSEWQRVQRQRTAPTKREKFLPKINEETGFDLTVSLTPTPT